MKLRHDDFCGGDSFFLVDICGDSASVVFYGDGTVLIEGDIDDMAESGKRFVDGVIDDFVDHVVESGSVIGIADIHAGTFSYGFESSKNAYGIGTVV